MNIQELKLKSSEQLITQAEELGIEIFSQLWMQIKLVLVILLSVYNEYLGRCLASLKNNFNFRSSKFFRIINEIPTVMLIFIVFLVIFKPIWG